MSTNKVNPALKVFAIMAVTLVIGYICVWIRISNNPFHSSAFQSPQERRILLLYYTDPEQLLKAGRQILKEGPKDPMNYHYYGPQHIEGFPVPRRIHIPKVISRLSPHANLINRNGYFVLQMQGGQADFGVRIYPEGFNGRRYYFTAGNRELLPGLEYFDYKYEQIPQYDKTIDYIIKEGKYPEPNQTDLNKK